MAAPSSVEIAVIGAGVVGLAVALRLAAEGKEVLLLDPSEPGSAASFGNAGTLADYACVPVGNPAVLRSLPQLLFDKDSPFALRWQALPQLAPWLARFVRQSLPASARANAVALASLLADALPAWREVAAEAGITDLLRKNGCLYLFRRESDVAAASWAQGLRAELGIRQEVLTPAEVAALEPGLPAMTGRGLYFPDAMHVSDPAALTLGLLEAAKARGADVRRARVTRLEIGDRRIRLSGPELSLETANVVIAAGAWSKPLARQAGDPVPLETERGYHLEFAMHDPPVHRPVCPVDFGFYMTPMAGRLRVAGTVELGGLTAPPNPRRLAYLERGVRQFFPGLDRPSGEWLGFRPSLPDSRPVIGRARNSPNVIHAFGHGHLGLTLAAITARLVAEIIGGRGDSDGAAPFAPGRFRI